MSLINGRQDHTEHNLIIPFTRMIAGPLDYEGGSMINGRKNLFRIVGAGPHDPGDPYPSAGHYVVYDSPLQILGGNISDYLRELNMQPLWKDTFFLGRAIVLDGKVSDISLVARKSGNDGGWGPMTDWTPRSIRTRLSFLDR